MKKIQFVIILLFLILVSFSKNLTREEEKKFSVYLSLAKYFYFEKQDIETAKKFLLKALQIDKNRESLELAVDILGKNRVRKLLKLPKLPPPESKNVDYLTWYHNAMYMLKRGNIEQVKFAVEKMKRILPTSKAVKEIYDYLNTYLLLKKILSEKKTDTLSKEGYYEILYEGLSNKKKMGKLKPSLYKANKWFDKGKFTLEELKATTEAKYCFLISKLYYPLDKANKYLNKVLKWEKKKLIEKKREKLLKLFSKKDVKLKKIQSEKYYELKPLRLKNNISLTYDFVTVEVKPKSGKIYFLKQAKKIRVKNKEDKEKLLKEYRELFEKSLKEKDINKALDLRLQAWLKFLEVYPNDLRANFEVFRIYERKKDDKKAFKYFVKSIYSASLMKEYVLDEEKLAKKVLDSYLRQLLLIAKIKDAMRLETVILNILNKKIIWQFSYNGDIYKFGRVSKWWKKVLIYKK